MLGGPHAGNGVRPRPLSSSPLALLPLFFVFRPNPWALHVVAASTLDLKLAHSEPQSPGPGHTICSPLSPSVYVCVSMLSVCLPPSICVCLFACKRYKHVCVCVSVCVCLCEPKPPCLSLLVLLLTRLSQMRATQPGSNSFDSGSTSLLALFASQVCICDLGWHRRGLNCALGDVATAIEL